MNFGTFARGLLNQIFERMHRGFVRCESAVDLLKAEQSGHGWGAVKLCPQAVGP